MFEVLKMSDRQGTALHRRPERTINNTARRSSATQAFPPKILHLPTEAKPLAEAYAHLFSRLDYMGEAEAEIALARWFNAAVQLLGKAKATQFCFALAKQHNDAARRAA